MWTKQFWKIFIVVFVVAIVANVLTAYLFDRAFPDSSWSWDTTTTTAVMIALFTAYIMHRKKDDCEAKPDETQAKVLEMITEKGEITNDDVEKAFGISDATATRYLDHLEKQGLIIQIGKEGRGVVYKLK